MISSMRSDIGSSKWRDTIAVLLVVDQAINSKDLLKPIDKEFDEKVIILGYLLKSLKESVIAWKVIKD